MQSKAQQVASQTVSLTVISGPDEGMTKSYRQRRITVGRDPRNDFVLSDGFVSSRHAEFVVGDEDVEFRDLKSRHGSTVVTDDVSRKLQNDQRETELSVDSGCEIQIGSTLIRLRYSPAPESSRDHTDQVRRSTRMNVDDHTEVTGDDGEELITTSHKPVQTLNDRFESGDARMAALFKLAGQLNGLTGLDEILELIVGSTFDAFPAANFFAVTMGSAPQEVSGKDPFLTRTRGDFPGDEETPILSTSIVERAAESEESILFTKDSVGTDITQSIIDAKITACMCAPLVGQKSLLGVMQVDTRSRGSLFTRQDLELFNILASNAAFAIERARLTEDIVEMFEGFVAASVNAIEARDPVTAGHSERVADYTLELADVVNDIETGSLSGVMLEPDELRELRYAALLHDFGKIAVGEDVIQKGTRLPPERMRLIRQRFDTIQEVTYRTWLYEHVRSLDGGDIKPDAGHLADIDERYNRFCRELDELYDWLEHISSKGYLADEEIERVKTLGQKTYIGTDGQQHRYLTPTEVENLCIQKGTLNQDEWEEMKSHAALSESYLAQIPWSDELQRIPCIAGAHHEKLDGSGYPSGLAGKELLPQVRMLTIADIFDALTASDRPYRKAATIDRAVEILNLESEDDKLDPELVEVFESLVVPRIADDVPNSG